MAIERYKLPEEHKQQLIDAEAEIKTLETEIKVLDEIGVDIKQFKSDVQHIRRVRDGLLKNYS